MGNILEAIDFPELVIGLAGPIGIDVDLIYRSAATALSAVGYDTTLIHITKEIETEQSNIAKPESGDFRSDVLYKMDHAKDLCVIHGSPDTLMRFALRAIRRHRIAHWTEYLRDHSCSDLSADDVEVNLEDRVVPKTVYFIRQLKRPAEVDLLRRVYGKQFILMSAYGTPDDRKKRIVNSLRRSMPLNTKEHKFQAHADELMYRDQDESEDTNGQHLRDTFPMADVFIDGIAADKIRFGVERFVDALFGRTDIAPTKDEYGITLLNQRR